MFKHVARVATDRPWRHLAAIMVLFALAGIFGPPVAGLLTSSTNSFYDQSAESAKATQAIESASNTAAEPAIIALVPTDSPATIAQVHDILAAPKSASQVVSDPRPGSPLVSSDGRTTYLAASLKTGADPVAYAKDVTPKLEKLKGVEVGGTAAVSVSVNNHIKHDLQRAELLVFPILFVVSLWVFRSAVAAVMPLFVGGLTIVTSMSIVRLINTQLELSTFALNLITGLGLGLSIDYSLFIISRYREELARTGPGYEALYATLRTAGKTVLFSALTVAGAGVSLMVFPLKFLYSMGIGTTVVALTGAALAVLALAPVLALLGHNINRGSLPMWRRASEREASAEHKGGWYRWTQLIMRRPAMFAIAGTALLLLLGAPFLRAQFAGADVSILPSDDSARIATERVYNDFPGGGPGADVVVKTGEQNASEVGTFAQTLSSVDHVKFVGQPQYLGDKVWNIKVVMNTDSGTSSESLAVVKDIRDLKGPGTVLVGGFSAQNVDQTAAILRTIPTALVVLALLTCTLLFLMTGSVILPIKALIMNVLTISAAFGMLVLVFQDGRFQKLLGFTSQGALESTEPVLIFAIVFGLSTDYAVFLLTRIKEARDAGAGERECVAIGLQRTGRIVTAAALLFAIAMVAFATSNIINIKELGLGVAFAVLVDAFVVRSLLVPSLMALLGRWNWWAPAPLRRIYERFGIEEG